MATSYLEDYTKYRTTASGWETNLYAVDDKIGRPDYIKVEPTTASGIDVDDAGTILV